MYGPSTPTPAEIAPAEIGPLLRGIGFGCVLAVVIWAPLTIALARALAP